MKIKMFQAATMQDALKAIKEELGPDAVILSTRHVRQGNGMLGIFGRPLIEVAAAVDLHPPVAEPALANGQALARSTVSNPPAKTKESGPSTARPWLETLGFEQELRESMAATHTPEAQAKRYETAAPERARPSSLAGLPSLAGPPSLAGLPPLAGPPTQAGSKPDPDSESRQEWHTIREELQSLRSLMENSLREGRVGDRERVSTGRRLPPRIAGRYHQLLRQGMSAESAQAIAEQVQASLPGSEAESEPAVRAAFLRRVLCEINVSGPLLGLGEWKKTVIVVGPTGVGKTTTLAKLAAHYALKEKRQVALITLDTYRVAAVEQLRTYAKVMGVSLDVALTKQEAVEFIRRRQKSELILIDTTGRSPLDEAGMEEVRQLVAVDHPLETHLVVAAGAHLHDIAERLQGDRPSYHGIPVNRLLVTKLDETSTFGGIFDLMLKTKLPLSYFTMGQCVPEDLELASPERLAELLLEGRAALKRTSGARIASRTNSEGGTEWTKQ
jgi:flagellar biosynthesis protein FlhF